MKTSVEIQKILTQWCLMIIINDHVTWSFTSNWLSEVLQVARALQIHVDNADDLEFNQYFKAG